MILKQYGFTGILLLTILLGSCVSKQENTESAEPKLMLEPEVKAPPSELWNQAVAYFKVLPKPADYQSPMAQLGKDLYYETALSVNGQLSCNSCHMLDKFGVDNEITSPGHDGTRGDRNSPTVYNTSFHIAQFWDGRASDLHEQAKGPILNPIEMGLADEATAEKRIQEIDAYHEKFKNAFPNSKKPITYNNITKAIAEFEKTLINPSRFDDYLNGDEEALTASEKSGLENFIEAGCISCHSGAGLGGHMYQKFGLIKGPYWEFTGSKTQDEGRSKVTGNDYEKFYFKVPALRNVEKTAPYFHDGSVADLSKAIDIMAQTQLGKQLSTEEIAKIEAFLKSLTGEIPSQALLASN